MILILTGAADTHADLVVRKLEARGGRVVRFDPGDFPSRVHVTLRYSARGEAVRLLRAGDDLVDLDAVDSVWFRRPRPPAPHAEIGDAPTRAAVAEECQTFVQDLWHSLDCQWVPAPLATLRRAEFKALQLAIAGRLGFELPPTLITNSPDEFLEFYRRHHGRVVSKRVAPRPPAGWAGVMGRYTEAVSTRDVGYASAVRYCPMIFQAYVPKRIELRITVVGGAVFAAEIHSQETNRTRHDWRRYDYGRTRYGRHRLPDDVARQCVCLTERLGLCYGAIDMVLTPDGRYVFLEINPNGQYLWIEHVTGLHISEAICDLLLSGASAEPLAEGVLSHSGGVR